MKPTYKRLKTKEEIDAFVIKKYVPIETYHSLLDAIEYDGFVDVRDEKNVKFIAYREVKE